MAIPFRIKNARFIVGLFILAALGLTVCGLSIIVLEQKLLTPRTYYHTRFAVLSPFSQAVRGDMVMEQPTLLVYNDQVIGKVVNIDHRIFIHKTNRRTSGLKTVPLSTAGRTAAANIDQNTPHYHYITSLSNGEYIELWFYIYDQYKPLLTSASYLDVDVGAKKLKLYTVHHDDTTPPPLSLIPSIDSKVGYQLAQMYRTLYIPTDPMDIIQQNLDYLKTTFTSAQGLATRLDNNLNAIYAQMDQFMSMTNSQQFKYIMGSVESISEYMDDLKRTALILDLAFQTAIFPAHITNQPPDSDTYYHYDDRMK